jgi:hypothetical protein
MGPSRQRKQHAKRAANANSTTTKPLLRGGRRTAPSAHEQEEALALAHSDVLLPREKTTPKETMVCVSSEHAGDEIPTSALREMGILCDEATGRDAVYTVTVKTDKRRRKREEEGGPAPRGSTSPALSYCDVANDEALESWAMDDDYVDLGNVWFR